MERCTCEVPRREFYERGFVCVTDGRFLVNTIGVAIGTYGEDDRWPRLARRARASVHAQTQDTPVVWVHDTMLHHARNGAARRLIESGCQWIIFLDADDELEPDYVMHMALAASLPSEAQYRVFQPSVRAVIDGAPEPQPFLLKPCNLLKQNYLTLGCMHSASLFTAMGGFDDWPLLEDWAYWLKASAHEAKFIQVPGSVYLAHVNSRRVGRNKRSASLEAETATNIRAMYAYLNKRRA